MVFEVITSDRKPKFFAPLSANDHSFPPFYHRKTKTPSPHLAPSRYLILNEEGKSIKLHLCSCFITAKVLLRRERFIVQPSSTIRRPSFHLIPVIVSHLLKHSRNERCLNSVDANLAQHWCTTGDAFVNRSCRTDV